MVLLVILAIFLGLILRGFFFEIYELSLDFHQVCIRLAPHSVMQKQYQALVCGQRLTDPAIVFDLKQLGLIHLFVISGAHLHFLNSLVKRLSCHKVKAWQQTLLLFIFVLSSHLQWPVFRAWLFLSIRQMNRIRKWRIPSEQLLLVSVIFCLSLNPSSYHSFSLPLSWLAGLGLILGKNKLSQSFFIYLMMAPLLFSLSPLSPWSIVVNAFVAPWIGAILFPASFMCFLLPPLTKWVDPLWQTFMTTCSYLSPLLATSTTPWPLLPQLILWMYCLLLHMSIFYKNNHKKALL